MNVNRNRTVVTAVLASLAGASTSVLAQQPPTSVADPNAEEIVVTGTSIRGVAPVGSNLITVDRAQIEASGAQTIQQVLRTVPAVTGFGNSAQGAVGQGGGGAGGFQSFDGAGNYTPTIHGLGASASNGTLILIDGHRVPLSGINHTLADPTVIAPLAIERVEILPDGASAVYGSDAVAGVLNFITRKNYDGFEGNLQTAFGADGYSTTSAGVVGGFNAAEAAVMFSYNYSTRDALLAGERPFTAADHRPAGGGNFASFNCAPASVSPATGQPGANLIFAYPYDAAGIVNNAANGFCDFSGVTDLVPEDERHNLLLKIEKQMSENLTLSTDLVFARQENVTAVNRGSVTATVYGPGSTPPGGAGQINPFFVGPPGVNSETVRFQADELFGPGAEFTGGAESLFGTFNADFRFGGEWRANVGATIGQDDSRQRRDGALCVSCALLALNGTTNSAANVTTPSVPGTTTPVLSLPLVPANALDVWTPAASNRTSAAMRAQMLDSTQLQTAHQTLKNLTVKFDGPLFEMGGGSAQLAAGVEYLDYSMREELSRERGTGPASTNSFTTFLDFDRDVTSEFVELLLPIVGASNSMRGVREFALNLSARHDDYSDFGSTSNPRFGINWSPINALRIRANYAESFTAPALTSRGGVNGVTAESSFGGLLGATASGVNANLAIPNTYPGAIGLPGCTAATPTCLINTATVPGIFLAGGNDQVTAQEGETSSIGIDFTPEGIEGLRLSVTYWKAKYLGAITAPQAAFAIGAPDLNSLLQLFPGGVPPATIAETTAGLPQTVPLAATSYFIYSFRQRNAFNLDADGIDTELIYRRDTGIGAMNFGLAVSRKLNMDQQFGNGGEVFSVLNTIGINTTFPSNETAARLSAGWQRNGFSADMAVNYAASYLNWNGSAPFPVIRNAAFSPIGGGQPVGSYTTVDLHFGYDFDGSGALSDASVFFDARDLFDEDLPFVNTALGFDGFNANPIGRVLTIGISKKW
jgi:iron complex outermembrane recepter protein